MNVETRKCSGIWNSYLAEIILDDLFKSTTTDAVNHYDLFDGLYECTRLR